MFGKSGRIKDRNGKEKLNQITVFGRPVPWMAFVVQPPYKTTPPVRRSDGGKPPAI